MQCEVDNSAETISPGNRFLLAQCPKVEKFHFSQNFFFEMFRWTRRMPIWGTWSFLASQNFQRKTLKRYKVVPSPRKTSSKMLTCSRKIRFGEPCWKLLQKSAISSFKVSKQSQIYVFPLEKNLLSQSVSLDTRNAVLTTPLKTFAMKPAFSCSLPMFWFQPKFFPGNVDTFGENFCQISGISTQYQKKKQNYVFFEKKINFINDFLWHMECGVYSSAKIVSPKNRQFFAHCLEVKKFWFSPKAFTRNVPLNT